MFSLLIRVETLFESGIPSFGGHSSQFGRFRSIIQKQVKGLISSQQGYLHFQQRFQAESIFLLPLPE